MHSEASVSRVRLTNYYSNRSGQGHIKPPNDIPDPLQSLLFPLSVTSALEHFQRRMSALLEGLEGVVCLMDDILVYRKNQEEHDERLLKVLQHLETAGLMLNREKCKFSQTLVKFLCHMVDKSGVSDVHRLGTQPCGEDQGT